MNGKRVAIVTATFLPAVGGAEVVAYRLARALESRGCRAYVITNFKPFLFAVRRRLPVRVLPLPPLLLRLTAFAPRLVFALVHLLFSLYQSRYNFSVWHANNGVPTGLFVADFCARRGLPATLRCSGEDIQVDDRLNYGLRRDKRIDDLVRRYYPAFNKVVATTNSMKAEIAALGVADAAIEVIPNPLDLSRFVPATAEERTGIRSAHGIGDTFLFLAVGRNHRKKGFGTLIEAVKLVVNERPAKAFCVLFVGTGFEPLMAAAAEAGLNRVVRFTAVDAYLDPTIPDPPLPARDLIDLYRAADCFVLPSHLEGFPNVIAEAMAAGLPVITTDAPGCRDMVNGFEEPILFPPGDGQSLARQMVRIMEDPDLSARLSAAAREAAKAFATDRIIARYFALFSALEESGRTSRR